MRTYTVFLIQWMVWSGYTLSGWLSGHDRFFFKVFMFLVFLQIAIYIGKVILHSSAKTSFVTIVSLLSYTVLHLLLHELLAVVG